MFSLKKGQLILIIAIITIIGVLLTLDLKPPGTNKGTSSETKSSTESSALIMENELAIAKKSVTEEANRNIQAAEKELESLSGIEKDVKTKELAELYANSSQFTVSGFYYLTITEETAQKYILAGEAFRKAYKNTQDSTKIPLIVQKATECFQSALKLEPNNLDAKTGLGSCYVDAGQNPMQGIQLLLGVVKEDPNNVNANLNLGMFSIRSGQYDKAIGRFETVAKLKPNAEIYGMLADAYEQTGNIKGAIASLKKAKEYIIDEQVLTNIDNYIKNLEK